MACHSSTYGGHHSGERTATKIPQIGFGDLLYLMIVSYMCLYALNRTKRVTSQNEMRCL